MIRVYSFRGSSFVFRGVIPREGEVRYFAAALIAVLARFLEWACIKVHSAHVTRGRCV